MLSKSGHYTPLFEKIEGLKFTTMAIYVDETIYKEDKTEEEKNLLYRYIYHLIYMLACKGNYFTYIEDYDHFSIYATNSIWERYQRTDLKEIKSVLNYLKASLFGMKSDYQRLTYHQIFDEKYNKGFDAYLFKNNLKLSFLDQYDWKLKMFMEKEIEMLPTIVQEVILGTPYRNDKLLVKNLYLSCIINILKNITLNNKEREWLINKQAHINISEMTIKKYDEINKEDKVDLWHLPIGFKDYVKLLCNKIKAKLNDNLREVMSQSELKDDVLVEALMSISLMHDEREDKEYE